MVQRIGSVKPLSAFLSAGVPAAARFIGRTLARSSISEEVGGGAAGVPPQTSIKHLVWDGATPADRTLLGPTMVRVLGAEFSDVGPVEALDGRRTERTAGASSTWGDQPCGAH